MNIKISCVAMCLFLVMAFSQPELFSLERRPPPPQEPAQAYSLEQAMSDRAQLNTIAFDGLAFISGNFWMDTFFPPGKVADYFGFQYLRDIDIRGAGHNPKFLTRIALNVLTILDDRQKAQLLTLAQNQAGDVQRFAEMRLPLIKAFRLNMEGQLPAGRASLNQQAVVQYSADLYALDGALALQRAQVMATILRSLNDQQRLAFARLKFGDSNSWPDIAEPVDRSHMPHEIDVAMMSYAGDMFSWYAGSLEADRYFCPERHGMYFGAFGLKTAPAMRKPDYSISTRLTGDQGAEFLAVLDENQRLVINKVVHLQRNTLREIAQIRYQIAIELRRLLAAGPVDVNKIERLSRRYGQLSYWYAMAFAQVAKTLTPQQKQTLAHMRQFNPRDPQGPFLYSTPMSVVPRLAGVEQFFVRTEFAP